MRLIWSFLWASPTYKGISKSSHVSGTQKMVEILTFCFFLCFEYFFVWANTRIQYLEQYYQLLMISMSPNMIFFIKVFLLLLLRMYHFRILPKNILSILRHVVKLDQLILNHLRNKCHQSKIVQEAKGSFHLLIQVKKADENKCFFFFWKKRTIFDGKNLCFFHLNWISF